MPGNTSGEKNQIRKLQLRMKIGTAPNLGGELFPGLSIVTEKIIAGGISKKDKGIAIVVD